jgi:hypothetical protein
VNGQICRNQSKRLALVVFMGHLSWKRISGGFLWQFQPLGHDAVMVFFVLSGFVIQYAAANHPRWLCWHRGTVRAPTLWSAAE